MREVPLQELAVQEAALREEADAAEAAARHVAQVSNRPFQAIGFASAFAGIR